MKAITREQMIAMDPMHGKEPLPWAYDDGGRADAGYKGSAGDCGVRAIAIATGRPYQQVYDELKPLCAAEKPSKRRRGKSSPRTGLHKEIVHAYFASLGWTWVPTMSIGSGCRVHLRTGELPGGSLVAACSKHYVAVVDGVLRDTYDSGRGGMRCVYGYWHEAPS